MPNPRFDTRHTNENPLKLGRETGYRASSLEKALVKCLPKPRDVGCILRAPSIHFNNDKLVNLLSPATVIFNTHDLILVMSVTQYLLLAVLLETTRPRSDISSHLLALILLLNALKSADTLLIWSDTLRTLLLAWEPDLLFVGSLAYWVEGPLLYWYVSSILYREFHFRFAHLLHLLPAVIAAMLLTWHYYLLPSATQREVMGDLRLMWNPTMDYLITLRNLSITLYGSWCLWELRRYRRLLQENYANIEDRERRWLTWFVSGFVAIAAWTLAVHAIGAKVNHAFANMLGVCTNYFHFVFVNSLVFVSIRYTHLFDGLNKPKEIEPASENIGFKNEQVIRVQDFVRKQKPFLDPDINIDTMARRLSLPERTLSKILNQHFGKNFFEFINEYRIEEAKRLLADPQKKDWNMLDILAEAGFSSKSTFNAIFKKYVGQTPSQFRKHSS